MKTIDLTGKRFGRLVVLCLDGKDKPGHLRWLCQCDCGKQAKVEGSRLRYGETRSCGCLRDEMIGLVKKTHGRSQKSPLYKTWKKIRERCLHKGCRAYKNYGGRGISLCQEWTESFAAFENYVMRVMGPKPGPEYSIDRINNDGNYEPGNIRWATPTQQARNSRYYLNAKEHYEWIDGKRVCIQRHR